MNYALITDGIVTNLIFLHPSNAEEFPGAVPVDDYPVVMGDTYTNGVFYRDGVALQTRTQLMEAEKNDMQAALNELGVTVDE